jgi:hypothetical protein
VQAEPTDQTLRILSETTTEKYLRTLQHTQSECLIAFRLPKPLLETLNAICADLDCNRSQLIRRTLKEFIAFHELDRVKTTRRIRRQRTSKCLRHRLSRSNPAATWCSLTSRCDHIVGTEDGLHYHFGTRANPRASRGHVSLRLPIHSFRLSSISESHWGQARAPNRDFAALRFGRFLG